MKIKNKIIGTIFSVIVSSFVFITVSESANAGECSTLDPCHTYAVLDDSGVVINTIVCQPSFCGGGILPNGNKVVPQVSANAEGKNQGGHYNPPGSGKEVVYSNGTFTINNQIVVNKVDVVVDSQKIETSTVSVSISEGNKNIFTYENTIGKTLDKIEFTTLPLDNNVSATISASEITSTSTITESTTLHERKTAEEVSSILTQRNLNLLQSRINRLLILLDGWIKK